MNQSTLTARVYHMCAQFLHTVGVAIPPYAGQQPHTTSEIAAIIDSVYSNAEILGMVLQENANATALVSIVRCRKKMLSLLDVTFSRESAGGIRSTVLGYLDARSSLNPHTCTPRLMLLHC